MRKIPTSNKLKEETKSSVKVFLILSFRRVLYVIYYLLGNSRASQCIVTPENYPKEKHITV